MTDSFVKRMKEIREQQNMPNLMLRLQVDGGGCQGFEYQFIEETEIKEGDVTFNKDNIQLITDDVSLPFLEGAEVDYVDDLIGAHFTVNNPNASSSCGCGTSFSV